MSLRIAQGNPNRKMVPPLNRAWSITKRLTLLYGISTFLLLSISAAFFDRILVSDMAREDNQSLSAEIQSLRMLLMAHPENVRLWREDVERKTLASAMSFIKYYVRILDSSGQIAIETPGMGHIVIPSYFPAPPESDQPIEEGMKIIGHDGRPLLLMSAWADPHSRGESRRLIQVALDRTYEDHVIAGYRRKVIIVLAVGVALSAVIGFVIAHEGLRPLKAMRRAFQRIGPEELNNRIGSKQWPVEIGSLAEAFDKMLGRLENSFASLSRFSADLAHELRTPINNLRGEAEVALYKARSADEYCQVLESSLEEYGRLSRMIENLLFLAHAESADTVVRRSNVDVRKEIEALFEFFDAVAEEKEITVTCDGDATVEADPTLFRHAISNILSNAFQYTPKGGAVTVLLRALPGPSVEIEVRDTGMGIEAEYLDKIFSRFYRTDRARAHYPRGTGLGFSIVKSIMDLHGGTVVVESEVGKGTVVTLKFS